jgi:hypothetical protein
MNDIRKPGRPPLPRNEAGEIIREVEVPTEGRSVTRSTRRPFGAMIQKLAYPERDGYKRHWFDDSQAGRIIHAEESGWTHVLDKEGKKVSRIGGTTANGGPQVMYLMELPQEWYEDDMRTYQEEINEREASLKRGEANRQQGDNRYIPAQGIKISS